MFAAILGFGLYGVSFKYSAVKKLNLKAVNITMYLVTTLTIAITAKMTVGIPLDWKFLLFGSVLGLSSYAFVLYFRRASAIGSTAVCWTILQMAIVLPFLTSALIYHEVPKWNHWLGLVCTGIGVALLGRDVKRQQQ